MTRKAQNTANSAVTESTGTVDGAVNQPLPGASANVDGAVH